MTAFVAFGTASVGNNTSVTPGLPAGTVVGDLVVIMASIRNSGAGSPVTPTGWTRLATTTSNVAFFSRLHPNGGTMPTITFSGGVTNADTMAQAVTIRATEPLNSPLFVTELLNASAQNISTPALAMTGLSQAVIVAAWKQDDATAYSTPAGFTAGGLVSTTTGDDASQQMWVSDNPGTGTIAASSITVTGGAAAISRAFLIGVRHRNVLTANPQPSWPPRVLVQLSPAAVGDTVELYRVVGGTRTAVRGGTFTATSLANPFALALDAELPFGVPVSYEGVVNGNAVYTSAAVTYALPGGKNAITDAITGLAAEVVIQEWTSRRRERRNTVFRVADGRNIVVSGPLGQFTSDVTLYTADTSTGANLEAVLEGATSGTVQIRQGNDSVGIDCYVAVTRVEEERYDPTTGSDTKRLWRLEVVETDAWSPTLTARGYTYADLKSLYTGLTYNDLRFDYFAYINLRQAILQ